LLWLRLLLLRLRLRLLLSCIDIRDSQELVPRSLMELLLMLLRKLLKPRALKLHGLAFARDGVCRRLVLCSKPVLL
jgi:hypothetical protein